MLVNNSLDIDLIRFTTIGNVDDGKSTLIGRLLYDSKSVLEDQLESIRKVSKCFNRCSEIDLSLLTDGLRSEREQGITIDVAYRYFTTSKRRFIIADTPGHIEYTRNMVTGASTSDIALILLDARNGVVEQTKRHSYIASLLKMSSIILLVNKMDLVSFSEEIFIRIVKDYSIIEKELGLQNVYYLPISALDGDNIVEKSLKMAWYNGSTLLHLLETIHLKKTMNCLPARFPIQYVIRSQTKRFCNYRAYAGQVASGTYKVGDMVTILPSYTQSVIEAIDNANESLNEAFSSQSIAIRLKDDVDVSRGDMLVKSDELPQVSNVISVMICWFSRYSLVIGKKYIIRHTTDEMLGIIEEVLFKVNIHTLKNVFSDKKIKMNDIAMVSIKTSKVLKYDFYAENRATGSLIIVDGETYETIGAGVIMR